jgi:hypothetical protein
MCNMQGFGSGSKLSRVAGSGSAFKMRIRNPDPEGQKLLVKIKIIKEISCFEVLDVLFGWLKASSVALVSLLRPRDK